MLRNLDQDPDPSWLKFCVADPKLFISDPDSDSTCNVIADPDSDPDPTCEVITDSDLAFQFVYLVKDLIESSIIFWIFFLSPVKFSQVFRSQGRVKGTK